VNQPTDIKEHTTMPVNLTDQDKTTLRTAAYGAVTLLSFAGLAGSAHKVAIDGSLALAAATGPIGHILAEKTGNVKLDAKDAAVLADRILPALTASTALLKARDPVEAEHFRSAVVVAVEAAATGPVGSVPAQKTKNVSLDAKDAAALADQILEALTASMALLKAQDPVEAEHFRSMVIAAVEAAARAHKGGPDPSMAETIREIIAALDA
jgi:hypothetical protein